MLILHCPCCGVKGEETEFHAGGEAHVRRAGPDSPDEAFNAYMFEKVNPKGVHFERWRHVMGCGKWFHAARDTVTLEVYGTYSAQTTEPPREIRDRISRKKPGWSWREFS